MTTIISPKHKTDTYSGTQIKNRWLLIAARAYWCVVAVAALMLFLLNYFKLIEITLTVCEPSACPNPFALSTQKISGFDFFDIPTIFWTIHIAVLEALMIAVFFAIGGMIFTRRSDDWMALVCSLALITISTSIGLSGTVSDNDEPVWRLLSTFTSINGVVLSLTFLHTFPDGRFTPSWMRWFLVVGGIWELLRRALNIGIVGGDSGFRLEIFAITVIWFIPAVYSQVYRYRYVSNPVQRQQTKWVSIMGGVTVIGVLVVVILYFGVLPRLTIPTLILDVLLRVAYYLAMVAAPLGIAFSLFRYRLWQVDLLFNRSLVYSALTALLGLLFLVVFGVVQVAIRLITGGEQPAIGLVASTALIVAAFDPARSRIQRLIDQRLFGLRVDLRRLEAAQHDEDDTGADHLAGAQIGPYLLEAPIGRGGMGYVYRAHHQSLARTVALKILSDALAHNEAFRTRFEREAKTVAGLRHPNIVTLYDFGEQGNAFYMAMEFIDGEELSTLLKREGALPLALIKSVVGDVAAALDYAHTQGLVHRDVKPSNVMLRKVADSTSVQAVLTDFGIAKVGDTSGLTQTGMLGTLEYAAPEQIMSAKTVDSRADIYALGVMTYQMLTGEMPFKGSVGEMVFAHLQQPPPDPRRLRADISDTTARVVLCALEKSPDERFGTAGEFAAALE
jgi:hypothetical protein